MCTGFIFKGEDNIYAYNLDINKEDFNYELIKTDKLFSVAITIGKTKYLTHGVNHHGKFGVLPFSNDYSKYRKRGLKRVDLLVNNLLKDKISIKKIKELGNSANRKSFHLHALVSDNFNSLLIEPGLGIQEIEKYQAIANFPLLKEVNDDNKFYGIDRYNDINKVISVAKNIQIEDAFDLLKKTSQKGKYSTKLSFVYSRNTNTVYYCLNRNFDNVIAHKFK